MTAVSDAPRVLVVEDEPTIADVVARYLQRGGYDTRVSHDGPRAVSAALAWRPALVVLDLMLPGIDGLEVMSRLNQHDDPPAVIMLTARGEQRDRIIGLRRGADDYVVKPFSPAELVARVDAVLRRTARAHAAATAAATAATDPPIRVGGLLIDLACRSVTVDGDEVALTAKEFDLLAQLATQPGRVFSRDELMETVWRAPFFDDTSTLTVHVRRLRAKLESDDPAKPRYIETARGAGYRLRPHGGATIGR